MISFPDSHRDLLDQEVVTLATIGLDGRPQLSEVWFLAEDDLVRLSLNSTRQKVKNLQRDPGCALLLLDLNDPHRYVEIRGNAEIQPDESYAFADRVGAKYAMDLRTMDQPGETRVIVTVEPTRIRSWP